MHEEIEIAGKEKYQVEKELKARIKILEDEVWNRGHGNMYIEQKRAESLREALEWKRREILKLREQKLHELEEMEKEKHFAPKPSKPVLVEKWNDSSYSWVDVEDDDSEWVLFS